MQQFQAGQNESPDVLPELAAFPCRTQHVLLQYADSGLCLIGPSSWPACVQEPCHQDSLVRWHAIFVLLGVCFQRDDACKIEPAAGASPSPQVQSYAGQSEYASVDREDPRCMCEVMPTRTCTGSLLIHTNPGQMDFSMRVVPVLTWPSELPMHCWHASMPTVLNSSCSRCR